jgi:hypothetical protein
VRRFGNANSIPHTQNIINRMITRAAGADTLTSVGLDFMQYWEFVVALAVETIKDRDQVGMPLPPVFSAAPGSRQWRPHHGFRCPFATHTFLFCVQLDSAKAIVVPRSSLNADVTQALMQWCSFVLVARSLFVKFIANDGMPTSAPVCALLAP